MSTEVIGGDLLPAERIALTVALRQLNRGDDVMPNIGAACILALGRLTGRVSFVDGDYEIRNSDPS